MFPTRRASTEKRIPGAWAPAGLSRKVGKAWETPLSYEPNSSPPPVLSGTYTVLHSLGPTDYNEEELAAVESGFGFLGFYLLP